ncbi:non-ribosomal peptide synthetase, partial [Nostoc cf. edaphicum LEGE 07299]|nr:non-ribosomal peptide synthetase [Nostoc cf. edaphicum LEGE 07299]
PHDAQLLPRIAESIKTDNNVDFSVPFEELRDLPLTEQLNLINEKSNFIFSDVEIEDFLRYYKLFKAHVKAMRNYVPEVYSQSITLFRASQEIIHDFDNPEWYSNDPLIGWGKCSSQPIQVIELPGDHFSIFVEPHIQELAKYLKDCIDNTVYVLNNGSKRS